jgi:hypothetical protein
MARQLTPNDSPMREPRPLRARYSELFPACIDCNDLADGLDNRCSKCASDREFQQRMASKQRQHQGVEV